MPETEDRFFGDAGGPDSDPAMIDFRGSDGACYALAYSALYSVALTSPRCIVLEFKKHKVVVRGRNLVEVYRGLVTHKVGYLREDGLDLAPESDTFIDSLTIEPRVE